MEQFLNSHWWEENRFKYNMGERCSLNTDILNSYDKSVVLPLTRPAQKTLPWHDLFSSQEFGSAPVKNINQPLPFWVAFDADTGNTKCFWLTEPRQNHFFLIFEVGMPSCCICSLLFSLGRSCGHDFVFLISSDFSCS